MNAGCRQQCDDESPCGGDRRWRADRPDAVGELALAGVDAVIVERRTTHEVDGSRALATRPGLAASPGREARVSGANEKAREARRGWRGR